MVLKSTFPQNPVDPRPVGEWLFEAIKSHGNAIALIDGATKKKMTYTALADWIRRLEFGLHQAGFRKGDIAAVVLPNCFEYVPIILSSVRRGGAISGVNQLYSKDELIHHFNDCRAKFVFTTSSNLVKVSMAAKQSPSIQKIYVIDPTYNDLRIPNVVSFQSLCRHASSNSLPTVHINVHRDMFALPYSSGTTGRPKGTMLRHEALSASSAALDQPDLPWPGLGESVMAFLPFFHIYGMAIILVETLKRGGQMIVISGFEPKSFLEIMQDYKVKKLMLVPPIMVFLAKHPMIDDYDLSSLEIVSVGAAPAGKDLIDELCVRFPNIQYVLQGYGMTEVTGASHFTPADPIVRQKVGSCGVLVSSFEGKIVDPESGKELRQGDRGEIWVRSPTLMAGYLNRPEATKDTIDQDGWLHTGDIGYYDTDGYWYVVDRIKELIKCKGFQVAPAELEDLLLSHDQIQDAAVIGVPDPRDGEVPKAFVVVKAGQNLTVKQIKDFVKDKVAPYKQLKGGVELMDVIPKSPSGKILRRILRDAEKSKKSKI